MRPSAAMKSKLTAARSPRIPPLFCASICGEVEIGIVGFV
jgi:hypothetical protein